MIYIASDHGGFLVKEAIKNELKNENIPFMDFGTTSLESVDYPEYAFKVAEAVAADPKNNRGILVCGSGVGVCIAANKVKSVLAGLAFDKQAAALAVAHDACNVMCLSGRYVSIAENLEIVSSFLNTTPLNDYHAKRVKQINEYEDEHFIKQELNQENLSEENKEDKKEEVQE